jgi:hypothetical protein
MDVANLVPMVAAKSSSLGIVIALTEARRDLALNSCTSTQEQYLKRTKTAAA